MPPHPGTESDRQGFALVTTVSGILVAEVIKARLERENIPVLLTYESAGLVFGITVPGSPLSQVHILCPVDLADVAREILADVNDLDTEPSEDDLQGSEL